MMKTIFFYLLITASLLITACKTSQKDDPTPEEVFIPMPGLGESNERPEGKAYTWPEGIKLLGKPNADENCWEEAKMNKKIYGAGGAVRLCLALQNTKPAGSQPLIVRIPHGLVWIAESEEYQNGIVLTPTSIEVPAGETVYVSLAMYCANGHRPGPAPWDRYEEEPVLTEYPEFTDLYRLLADKKINLEDYGGEPDQATSEQLAWVQIALWEITKTGKITSETRRMLENLPAR